MPPWTQENPVFYEYLFDAFAFILGATVGSFLNVCIYRMPRDLSVNKPKRSFCPSCNYQIPFHNNIPLVSWLALRGKCANCGAKISFRYFGVELLTAIMFLAVWLKCSLPGGNILFALPWWVFTSLVIVATFIDFEHFIIPDEITKGGVVAGIVFSALIPAMMDQEAHWKGALWSAIAAAIGYGTLWLIVQFGKFAFGKKVAKYDAPTLFTWKHLGTDAELKVGEETILWNDMFFRPNDRLIIHCTRLEIGGKQYADTELVCSYEKANVGGDEYTVDDLKEFQGEVTKIVIPREAMGFGDVKFIAAIGAFLGWQSVFFTIALGSLIGSICGVTFLLIQRRDLSSKIPFGPYLTAGALIWMFTGPELVRWYLSLMTGGDQM